MQFVQAKHYYPGGGNTPLWIVIHDMEYPERPTGAEWCANFFAGLQGLTAPKASAHICVDNDSSVQCVAYTDGAWHCPGSIAGKEVNRHSIGIEHAGYARQTAAEWRDAYSTAMLEMSAGIVAELCIQFDIPAVRLSPADLKAGKRGIAGHADFTTATGKGSHWDPGPNFPWDWYMERVVDRLRELQVSTLAEVPADAGEAQTMGWVPVSCDGEDYLVAPIYVPFMGIGQAQDLAKELGCILPTPALVDAIWQAADLRIAPLVISDHDGTPQTMASAATFERVRAKLAAAVGDRSLGTDFHLLAGAFKDIVDVNGKPGLYGWHRPDGTVIQGPFTGHARGWLDYSQALRLVRKL